MKLAKPNESPIKADKKVCELLVKMVGKKKKGSPMAKPIEIAEYIG